MQVSEGQIPLTSCQCHHGFRLEEWGSGGDSVGEGWLGCLESNVEYDVGNHTALGDRH